VQRQARVTDPTTGFGTIPNLFQVAGREVLEIAQALPDQFVDRAAKCLFL